MPGPPLLPPLAVPVGEIDHVFGPAEAPVTLVEYGDYQCPHCAAAYAGVKDLKQRRPGLVRFVFRNFPLATFHPRAMILAEAAESAGLQQHFWEMHALLFERQSESDDAHLRVFAQEIGLDMDRFEQDLASHVCRARVQHDFRGGMRSGVKSTPAFFINGVRHAGAYDENALQTAVELAAQAGAL